MFHSPAEVIDFIAQTDVKFLDVRLSDFQGGQHHFNVPAPFEFELYYGV